MDITKQEEDSQNYLRQSYSIKLIYHDPYNGKAPYPLNDCKKLIRIFANTILDWRLTIAEGKI